MANGTSLSPAAPVETQVTDPYAGIATPIQTAPVDTTTDPYAGIATPIQTSSAATAPAQPAQPSFMQNVGVGLKKTGSDIYNTAASIAPTTQTTAAQSLPGKALGLAEDVASGINNLTGVTTVVDSVKNAAHLFDAYEKARQSGASVTDALRAANERAKQADAITPALEQRMAEFKKNPTAETTRALGDLVATAATIYGAHKLATPAISETATAEDTNAANAASVQDRAQPIETKTAQAVGKVKGATGLSEGRTATPEVEVKQTIADQTQKEIANELDAGKKVQANLQSGLRDTWNKVADDNGVPRPKADASIREVGQQVGDSIYARSKASYKLIDDATGGKFQPNADALKNVNLKLRNITGTDDTLESNLMAQKQRLEWQQEQFFDEAAKNGVPKETVNAAKADFKKAQAIYDTNHHVRMTTTGLPADVAGATENPEIVKSGNLMNRLVKDYSPTEGGAPGRLTQAVGEENAHSLLNHTSTAQVAQNKLASAVINNNPEFSALPATESKALRELIRPRVTAGKMFGTNVDWKGALNDFDKLPPEELKARFSDPAAVRAALRRQATLHNLKVAGTAGLGTIGAAGTGYEIFK